MRGEQRERTSSRRSCPTSMKSLPRPQTKIRETIQAQSGRYQTVLTPTTHLKMSRQPITLTTMRAWTCSSPETKRPNTRYSAIRARHPAARTISRKPR